MQGKHSVLEGGQELSVLSQQDFNNGSILKRIIDAVNSLATNVGASAVGKLPPPPPINSIQVSGTQSGNVITCPSEHLHFTVTHNSELKKGVQYIHEISTEPNFLAPHVIDSGCSRSVFMHLPSMQADGVTPNTYYLRSYPQYHGSDPQKPTVLGGLAGATQIKLTPPTVTIAAGGAAQIIPAASSANILPSTGSGTASPAGTQGGKGLGDVLTRPAPTTKRSIA
jgi:hypothetical protein